MSPYIAKLMADLPKSSEAYIRGHKARLQDEPVAVNPYNIWTDNYLHQCWKGGWRGADQELKVQKLLSKRLDTEKGD